MITVRLYCEVYGPSDSTCVQFVKDVQLPFVPFEGMEYTLTDKDTGYLAWSMVLGAPRVEAHWEGQCGEVWCSVDMRGGSHFDKQAEFDAEIVKMKLHGWVDMKDEYPEFTYAMNLAVEEM